jgi:flagellar biosynthesis GTPase FlhF
LQSPRQEDAASESLENAVRRDKDRLVQKRKESGPRQPASSAAEKLSAYLEQLAQQKRQQEQDGKKNEERNKRRAQLLSERIRMEALERKLMAAEDDNLRFKAGVVGANAGTNVSTKKVSAEAVESMINRLAAKAASKDGDAALSVPARDYADWKRKNNVPSEAQVFCMTGEFVTFGQYMHLRKVMLWWCVL